MFWRGTMDPDSFVLKRKKIIVSLAYRADDEFIAKLEEEFKTAAENAGYELIIQDSMNSAALQLKQVEEAYKRGAQAIFINLVDPNAAPELIKAAGNMKVIFVAFTPTDMSLLNENVIYVGADQKNAGELQGEWLANYFKERGKNDITYILLKGIKGLPITEERTNSALQALAENGIKATPAAPPIYANFERREAMDKLTPILESGVKFDAIISNNDAMALGAIEALEQLNMNPAKTVIVGIDATEPAVRALLTGKLAMTVYQNRKNRAADTIAAVDNMLNQRPFDEGLEFLVSPDQPYVLLYPYEEVTKYHIPNDLYF